MCELGACQVSRRSLAHDERQPRCTGACGRARLYARRIAAASVRQLGGVGVRGADLRG